MGLTTSILEYLSTARPRFIAEHGLSVVDDRFEPSSFGNSFVVLENAAIRLRLERDRGQHFFSVFNATDNDWLDGTDLLGATVNGRPSAGPAYRLESLPAMLDIIDANFAALIELVGPLRVEQTAKLLRDARLARLSRL